MVAALVRLLLALILAASPLFAAEVVEVEWPTSHASPPANLPASASPYLPAFRFAMHALPESSIVSLALGQPSVLGLNAEQAGSLRPLLSEQYKLMGESPEYRHAPTLLPYCFSERQPAEGKASVYVPSGAGPASPVIFFLHGYGGSLRWCQHYLSSAFPDHIIICPAFGIGDAPMPPEYAEETLQAVAKELKFPLQRPTLIGLSAGGFTVCRLYVCLPHTWSQLICLAAYPPDDVQDRFTPEMRVRFLSGGAESFVAMGELRRRVARVRRNCTNVEAFVVSGAEHFFLLTHEKESEAQLRHWLAGDEHAPLAMAVAPPAGPRASGRSKP